jgi:hypothetical protein
MCYDRVKVVFLKRFTGDTYAPLGGHAAFSQCERKAKYAKYCVQDCCYQQVTVPVLLTGGSLNCAP